MDKSTPPNFHLIANAGAVVWQYCLDTKKSPRQFALGLQALATELDTDEKTYIVCNDNAILLGVFEEVLKAQPQTKKDNATR